MAAEAVPGSLKAGMDTAKSGDWFIEVSSLWPGTGLSLKIDEVLFQGRSDFQVRPPAGMHAAMHGAAAGACSRCSAVPLLAGLLHLLG